MLLRLSPATSPIDFHSQTSDPGSVTREDLVSALYPCLLAHPDFAPLCLSLIQEKLESSLKSAKVDSYNLLVEAAEVWPGHVIAPHLGALWQTVRADLLPPRDLQTAEVALKALQAIIRTSNEPYLSPVVTSVMSCCEVFLSDVQMSMFEPSFRLLLSIMQSNTIACLSLSKKLLPKLISLLKVTDKNMCDVILDKITSFVEVCLQMNPTFEFSPDTWKEVVACTDTSMQAYYTLVPGVAQIDFDCRLRLYQNIMLHLTSSPTLGSACIKCLQAMAMIHADEVEEHVLKKISFDDKGKNVNQAKKEFEIVCSLAVVNTFHSTLDQLFNNFVTHGEPYLSLAISCLRNLLEIDIEKNNKKLFKFLFSHSCVISKLINLQVEEENLLNSAAVVRTLVASQEPSDQARCVPSYTKVVLQHKKQLNRVVFLEALLGPLWPQVTILTPEEIMTYIVPVAMNCFESELSRTYALQLLASIINKSADNVILDRVSQIIASYEAEKESTVCACSYITKALVIRNHPVMRLWIDKLLDLLNSEVEEVAQAAAEGFLLILQDSDTSESHCVVRLLYRQHLFYLVLPRIVHSQAKLQHLKALAYLLQVVPHTVYMTHIKEILPLLVKSLDLDSESLLLTVLTTLSHLLSASDCFLQNHVDTFIPRFIHLARSSLFMHVRIASLKCLGSCLKFPPMLLLPHKQKVIADLMNCLDDKKRLVRKEAARTRSKWYLLGAPVPD
ncbi:MMS19 nucleotide excision repair protein homolog [Macrosteles quadrilineatus]|uniref:MMS19 nucleotide excision repair protein homolog n=1 Tax=Macrosteles quadrilineatus TaxID=74068 RepID=UPI0023E0C430|nr:MMS19 nucleotide excision repair protein homolog [Macrosteles quadrilineatus]XP_054259035.1 MMS19 nucleotide excision repair protein homolog [Macrosteles quadrilineatus]